MTEAHPLTFYVSAFFKNELPSARSLSKHTHRNYKVAIRSFINFLEEYLRKDLFQLMGEDITYESIYAWMLHASKLGEWKAKTWNSRLSALKTFVRFLARTDIRYIDLQQRVELIRSKKKSRNPANYITLEEFDSILRQIGSGKFIDFRDKLIFQILFFSGARVSELTGLRTHDITFLKDRSISLYFFGKGRKGRTVIIKEQATIQNLKKFLQFRSRDGAFSEYLFPGQNGNQMTARNIGRIVKKHFSNSGENSISPHSFRHSAAMHWLESGMGLFAVACLLGHEDVTTTTNYLRSTFKIKSEALDNFGHDKIKSVIFKPEFSNNQEYWDRLGIDFRKFE